jgi:two-component system OmpR family sensor kinase
LSAEDAARVFERFYRADPSRSRDRGGSGLGLAIVAAIAQAHGGRAVVASVAGRGAQFTLWLPATGALNGGWVGEQVRGAGGNASGDAPESHRVSSQ